MSVSPRRILVIRLSAMGDVAMTVPVLHSVQQRYPDAEIYVLSNKNFAAFFEQINGLNFIGIKLSDYNGFGGLFRLYKELKKYQFDAILDLHNVIRSKVIRTLFKLSGKKVCVVDKGRKQKKQLTRRVEKLRGQLKTTFERYADVFRLAGFPIEIKFTSIYTTPPVLTDAVHSLLNSNQPIMGIAPFAQHEGKIYPINEMEKVVKHFHNKGVRIFLFGGGASEKAVLENWGAQYANCVVMAGRLSLSEELQLISRLNVMVSMDSANMHLASLVNTPVVSVWGATHHYAGFYGWGQNSEDMVQSDICCRPCSIYGNKPCFRKDYACLISLEYRLVITKVERYVN